MIAGFLEKPAMTAVLEIILNPTVIVEVTATAGIFAPLALGGIEKLVSAGLHELINPILSNILSFSTGGIAVNPTLAIVGDRAATSGGTDNTEFILGSDQMKAIIGSAVGSLSKDLLGEIRQLRSDINTRKFMGVLKGRDIYLANAREEAENMRGSRVVFADV